VAATVNFKYLTPTNQIFKILLMIFKLLLMIFNQLPCFVKTFQISIYSATTGKNFTQIAHHLSEL